MLRFVGFTVLCFLVPFVLFALWRLIRHGIAPGRETWPPTIWYRLTGLGVLIALVAIAVLVTFSSGEAGRVYHPARLENGRLIPGGFE